MTFCFYNKSDCSVCMWCGISLDGHNLGLDGPIQRFVMLTTDAKINGLVFDSR